MRNLVTLQKKAVRIADGAKFKDHTSPIFARFRALKLIDLVNYSISVVMYRVSVNDVPPKIAHMFISNQRIHNYNTRKINDLHIQFARTNVRSHTLRLEGIKVWNEFPLSIRSITSLHTFKRMVKKLLLEKY